ncbi:RNA polymerase sigma factor [Catenulispora subtropica]|uniref:RNA polymerase, sigma-24 subunit, ECF subfamily n=1 Tax=Catenulispora subtropica TaxID=450798 RepID=A0ABN2SLX6_9ACTN
MAWGDLDSALAAARRGEETGFAELWHALHPPLLRYLRAVVGDTAEDVASETWLQAAKDVRGYRGDAAGFRVWLFRVARHRALDELRKTSRRKEDNGDVAAIATDWPSADDTESVAAEREDTERALRLIARLPKDQAEAVLLRVVAGLDVAQTAKVLDKRDGAVRIAAMRGLKRLAVILAEQADGAGADGGSVEGAVDGAVDGAAERPAGRAARARATGGAEGTGDAGQGRTGRGSRTVKGAEHG